MVTETVNQLFDSEDDAQAAMALKKSIHKISKFKNPKLNVDVHLPNPVLADIRRLQYVCCEFYKQATGYGCQYCGGGDNPVVAVPIQVFQVTEIKNDTAEVERRGGRRARAVYHK